MSIAGGLSLLALFSPRLSQTQTSAEHSEEIASGKRIYESCIGCHRVGSDSSSGPNLIGLGYGEIVSSLHEYKSYKKVNIMMNQVALSLTDSQIRSVARYLSSQRSAF